MTHGLCRWAPYGAPRVSTWYLRAPKPQTPIRRVCRSRNSPTTRTSSNSCMTSTGSLAKFANDPNELQLMYDLYRVPFYNGEGGVPEPIAGASRNGMSNTFPKVSPDGRWIVFVECRNGQLLRPDSQLYIVPAGGGQARRMRCNTPRMNSWHSFSPNGHWLVFSSKSASPSTEMAFQHIDTDGNDSPPI